MNYLTRVLVFVLVALSGNAFAKVTTDSDRFTGETTVMSTADTPNISGGIDLAVIVKVAPDKPLSSQRALIDLVSVHDSWEYLECHSLYWLADGERVPTPKSQHSGKVGSGYVIEHVMQEVPFSTIVKFANSNKVEYKICNDQGELSAGEMSDLKDVVDKVKTAISKQ